MILITGGAGFIGSNFVLEWLAHSCEPIANADKLTYAAAAGNLAAAQNDARYTFACADICDRTAMDELLAQHRPRAVINFAAETHVDRSISAPAPFVQSNIIGTYTLLEACRDYWQHLPESERNGFRYLQVSTDEVFGSLTPDDPPVCETAPYRPNNPYAASKAAGDHLARAWHQTFGLPVLTVHCCNNFGPRQNAEKLIPHMIAQAIAGAPLPVYGDGAQMREWLYVADCCAAIRMVLAQGTIGSTYSVGGQTRLTNLDLVQRLCAILDRLRPEGRPHARHIAHVTDRAGHDRRYATDSTHITETLGWRAAYAFDAALAETVAWYLAHQAA